MTVCFVVEAIDTTLAYSILYVYVLHLLSVSSLYCVATRKRFERQQCTNRQIYWHTRITVPSLSSSLQLQYSRVQVANNNERPCRFLMAAVAGAAANSHNAAVDAGACLLCPGCASTHF